MSTLKSWCASANSATACSRAISSCTNGPLRGQLPHARLDARQVVIDEVTPTRKAEVVEEAVLDGGANIVLGAGEEFHDGSRHQVCGAVAQDLQGWFGRCWERRACFRGVIDNLVWHAMPILRSRPAIARRDGCLCVSPSGGTCRTARPRALGRAVSAALPDRTSTPESRTATGATSATDALPTCDGLVAQPLVTRGVDGAAPDAAVLGSGLVHCVPTPTRAQILSGMIARRERFDMPDSDVTGGVYAAAVTVCQHSAGIALLLSLRRV